MIPTYEQTLVSPSPWTELSARARTRTIKGAWAVTEVLLIAGFFTRGAWHGVIAFSALHALAFWLLVGRRVWVFPAQLRVAFTLWVTAGTLVPGMAWMMVIPTIGGAANLAFGYCPLARMLYLLPWNRDHGFFPSLPWRVMVARPMPGRFRVALPEGAAEAHVRGSAT